jgi:hypothetical protein
MLVTFSEFARLKGVSAAAVTIASKSRIKDAIVERNGKRMLDRDKALEQWDRNTKRNGSERVSDDARLRDRRTTAVETGATPQGSAADVSGVTSEALKTLIMGLPEDQIPGLDVSRERKAHYDAEVARLEALKERQELVLVQEVRQEASRLAKQVRDLLLMIPARNAAKVAAMQDQEKVRALLQSEIETALRGLANA